MKDFEYCAVDAGGTLVTTRGRARDVVDLDRELEAAGQTLVRARELRAGWRARRRTLDHGQLLALTTQLATVSSAGVPLVEGLESIGKRLSSQNARELVAEMVDGLRAGDSLSQVIERHPSAFPDLYRHTIVAGEASGALDRVLLRLARYLEWSRTMRATTTQALVYPAFLACAIGGLVVLLLVYVLPKILVLFPGGTADLPFETRVVVAASDFLRGNALVLSIALAVLVASSVACVRTPRGRELFHRALLAIPKLGPLLRQIATSRWASTAGILQSAGCDVFTVLDTANAACGNASLQAAFARSSERVRGGSTITAAFEREDVLDPLLVQMVGVGERSGELDTCLERLVAYYDDEVPRAVKRLLGVLEPLLLVGAGAVVAFILLAALLPIFDLYQAMH